MSRGPGRVQRVILDMIATPEASAGYISDYPWHWLYGRGPVGVPIDAAIAKVYGGEQTRSQRVAVYRAVGRLQGGGVAQLYSRRVCPVDLSVDPSGFHWKTGYVGCGCQTHLPRIVVGRPCVPSDPAPEP